MCEIRNSMLLFWEIIDIKIMQSNFALFDLLMLLYIIDLKCFISKAFMFWGKFFRKHILVVCPELLNAYTIDNGKKCYFAVNCHVSVSFQKNEIKQSCLPSVSRILPLLQESISLFEFFKL